jgi:hypothetical protein
MGAAGSAERTIVRHPKSAVAAPARRTAFDGRTEPVVVGTHVSRIAHHDGEA